MGLFSRRIVQGMLEENRQFMPADKLRRHINHLNGNSAVQRVTTEWEIAVLNGLSKLGRVEFEPKLAGVTAVDALFTKDGTTALIEIATVSDRGLDEQNPVHQLCDELIRRVRQSGLNPNKFGVSVDGNWRDLSLGGPKPRLFIPRSDELVTRVFNDQFTRFLARDTSHGEASFRLRSHREGGITITYDPAQEFFQCRYLDYTVAFTTRNNPVYNRLRAKSDQLKKSQFRGMRGIVLCDAGCRALSRPVRRGFHLGAGDIISSFLKEQPSVAFVVVLLVESEACGRLGAGRLEIVSHMYSSPGRREAASFSEFLGERLPSQLPSPERAPINAFSLADEGNSFSGGGTVQANRIKISVRSVLGVLSGQMAQDKFMRDNEMFAGAFARMLRQGRMVREVRIERTQKDDDWIEFLFSEADPAISRFRGRGEDSKKKEFSR
jgi:hypothetical protein